MNTGAIDLVETARNAGVEVCFANAGTTEVPIVMAIDQVPGIRVVLGLFEGVCTGAADGWARMTGKPAATLLHLGPGLANGLANLHNARRARTPVVNWIGQHTTGHQKFDPPLNSDITALTGWVGWTRTIESTSEMAEASYAAVEAALGLPGQVASLIIPSNFQWEPGSSPIKKTPSPKRSEVSDSDLKNAASLLRTTEAGLLLGGNALTERGLRAAAQVSSTTGCNVWTETWPARQECGRHVPAFPVLPYFPEQARAAFGNISSLVLSGATDPVAFFGYPNQPSRLAHDDVTRFMLSDPDHGSDATLALEALVEELNAPLLTEPARELTAFIPEGEPLNPVTLCQVIAASIPENSILINEAATTGFIWNAHASSAAPHTMLTITGGAIGQGLPNALGASIACPGRRVIAFQADGCGMYTLQALWSMAREGTDVTVVVCSNRRYHVIQLELARAGSEKPGLKAHSLTDLTHPIIDWSTLARGFGLPASTVRTVDELTVALNRSFAANGPSLIEVELP